MTTLRPEEGSPAHFRDKDAVGHVVEAQAQGLAAASEIHGTEVPGHISAAADSARETSLVLLLLWTILFSLHISFTQSFLILVIFSAGWLLWKLGRSAWLGWSRLERLHRVLEQERWEIQHHRQQERSELKALYAAKGFGGKLLEDVLDVLMSDDNILLKVMIEEELGLTLESHEHPLKQGLGALIGGLLAVFLCLIAYWIYPVGGIAAGTFVTLGIASGISAYHSQNSFIPAIVWNMGLGALSFGSVYFLLEYFKG